MNHFIQSLMMIPKGMEGYSLAISKVKAILAVLIFCMGFSIIDDFLKSGLSWELKALGIMACLLCLAAFAIWFSKNPTYVLQESSKGFLDSKGGHIVIPLKSWGGIYFFWFQQFALCLLVCLLIDRGFLFFSLVMVIGSAPLLGHQKFHVSLRTQWIVLALALLAVCALLHMDPVSLPITSNKELLI